MTKPFSVAELMARIEAVLRRTGGVRAAAALFAFGAWLVDPVTLSAARGGQTVARSRREIDMLGLLARERGRIVSRRTLLAEVWGMAHVDRIETRTVRAYRLKESLEAFWTYTSPYWAGWFLDQWCNRAMRSRLEPIKKCARTMRRHRPLLLNWFRAKKELSSGCVEGLNTNVKLALRKARGVKTYPVAEIALYHELGRLPEPEFTRRFS